MAKIPKVYQRRFGSAAGADQLAKFGSLAAGAPVRYDATANPVDIMSLSNWLDGWFGAVIGANSPAIEDVNAAFFVAFYQLAYLMQSGIPEWDTTTIYYKGSRAVYGGLLYVSLTDDNDGNQPDTSPADWVSAVSARYDIIIGSAAQVASGLATHSTWAAAITAASAGQVVRALPGTWVENVTVSKQLQIEGSGYGTFIDGSLTVTADNCSIEGIRIDDDMTLNSGADGNVAKNIFLPAAKTFVDNGTGNLLEGIQA